MHLRRAVIDRFGDRILEIANLIQGVLGSGGKILLAGNGEMAALASQFAAVLLVRLNGAHPRQALPALALTDSVVMTAASAELGHKEVFARQVDGLANKGDLLVLLSYSGDAEYLIRAAQMARQRNVLTLGMLGGTGGRLADMVDMPLVIPHASSQRVQEELLFVIHVLVELIESDLSA